MFLTKLQKRLKQEESGFTLIELLIVLVIIGILLAIAVPSYLGFKDRANKTAAAANVRSAIPSVEAYYADNGTYVGMTPTGPQGDRRRASRSSRSPSTRRYGLLLRLQHAVGNKRLRQERPGRQRSRNAGT